MERNLATLKKINRLNLPDSFFLCSDCKSYLTAPIWSVFDGTNLCDACCKKQPHFTHARNATLEALQVQWKYPCVSAACRFIGSFDDARAHAAQCRDFFTCPMCKCDGLIDEVHDHFKSEHGRCMSFVGTSLPRFTNIYLDLPQRNPNRVFRMSTHETSNEWMMITEVHGSTLNVAIIKCYNAKYAKFERITQDVVAFKWKSRVTLKEHQYKVSTCSYIDFCEGRAEIIPIPMTSRERLDLDIHFNDYEKPPPYPKTTECPVCFEGIGLLQHTPNNKCVNGHSVCCNCRLSISNCPLCREPLQQSDNPWIDYFFHSHCKTEGCIRRKELGQHHPCSHQTDACPECSKLLPLIDMVSHLKQEHGNCDGFENMTDIHIQAKQTLYCVYKEHLFRLCTSPGTNNKVNIQVQIMFATDKKVASKYCYELHIYQTSGDRNICRHKIRNVCQLLSDPFISASVDSALLCVKDGVEAKCSFYIFDT